MDDATFAKKRLEYLRGELRAAKISYGKLHELQSLVKFIDPADVELLEAAGVPEHDYTDEHDWDEAQGRCLNCGATDCSEPCPEAGPEPEPQPLADFIKKYSVALSAERIDKRPDGLMEESARHFKCRITAHLPTRLARRTAQNGFALYFSQGLAHTEEPSAADVLNCRWSETYTIETGRMEDGDYIFIECVDRHGVTRLSLPPKVSKLLARQRDALTTRRRKAAGKRRAELLTEEDKQQLRDRLAQARKQRGKKRKKKEAK